MKRFIILTALTIACCDLSTTVAYAQTVTGNSIKSDTAFNFCHTSAETKFYLSRVQRAKEYSAQVLLLEKQVKLDSLRDLALRGELNECSKQSNNKDTLIAASAAKKLIVTMDRDQAISQKRFWKAGFLASWSAIFSLFVYSELK